MNICLTGLNVEKIKLVGLELAKKLNYDFFDADLEFEPELIKTIKLPISQAERLLNEKERELLLKLAKQNNAVFTVSAEIYLSNNNAKFVRNSITVVLLEDNTEKLYLNLQNLLIKKCKYSTTSLQDIIDIIGKK